VQPQPEPGEPEMGDEVNRADAGADDRRSGRTPVSDTIALSSRLRRARFAGTAAGVRGFWAGI